MVVCLSWARVFLYQMLSLINVYEMISTRKSLIALYYDLQIYHTFSLWL